ncbi:MAG: type II toxin-antitoxin system death-on-curing family toxin [Clostridia bacterium]|jgi:death-on-curing family protein
MKIKYLTVEEIIAINQYVILKTSPQEQIGVLHPDLLDSAVARPQQSVFGQDAYPTIFEKAAALLESLARNHCFHNANKRTAFLSMLQFLNNNGYDIEMDSKEAEDFVVDIVQGKYTFEQIVDVIRQHSIQL